MQAQPGKVALMGMQFYAHHGFYKEENTLGNRYEVDFIAYLSDINLAGENNDLNATVNYEVVYKVVKEAMAISTPLLETIANTINTKLAIAFPFATKFECTIRKYNPPIGGLCAFAEVTLEHYL
ncbi:MAG: dihydroneopterin aldolase [Flexibacteraceae bacterium]|jgi:dihydroneopterin aldolase